MSTEKARKRIRASRGPARYEVYPKKTSKHLYFVLYDNELRKELFAFSTLNLTDKTIKSYSSAACSHIGEGLAKLCEKNGIVDNFYFNRLSYQFHGKIKIAYDAFVAYLSKLSSN